MPLEIVRFANHKELGCPGRLYHDGEFIAYTIEQPWVPHITSKGGKPYNSCVPEGIYDLIDYESERFGKVKILVNPELDVVAYEKDRTNHEQRFKCLAFHRGSYSFNFRGCVGAGKDYLLLGKHMGISGTRETCKEVNARFKDEKQIIIRWLI